jgi:virulence factor Mce-like protein
MKTTRRARINLDPALNPAYLAIGALAIVAAVALLVVAIRAQKGVPGRSYYDLTVQIDGARVLPPQGSDVRIAGRRVGQTRQAQLERGVATVDLQLDSDVGPLPADTWVRLRSQGLLGAQYVDVVPGRASGTLPSGSVIGAARTSAATTLADVLQTLDGPRRSALRAMLRGLGGGLAGRGGELNDALRVVPKGFRDFQASTAPLLSRRGATSRLVREADALSGALDPVRGQLAGTFAPAQAALRPLADERASVASLLSAAPGDLEGARHGLAGTDPLLARAERFARAASGFTAAAPQALTSVTDLLRGSRRPLRSARGVLLTARAAVPPTLRLTRALNPVLPRLRSTLEVARDPALVLGRYSCDIERWGRTWRSFLGYAPRGQSGRLGPLNILRTTLSTGGGLPGVANPGTRVAGDISPCEPDRGPRR